MKEPIALIMIFLIGFVCVPSEAAASDADSVKRAAAIQGDVIDVRCPNTYDLKLIVPAGWQGRTTVKSIEFSDASYLPPAGKAAEGTVVCQYGSDATNFLTRTVPGTHRCRPAGSRDLRCERAKPPIKIPGQ